ncbi:MAG: DUF1732 domain-containing protein [bacterium]
MIQSMTGYGEYCFRNIRCELKSLNHRFFDANIFIPSCLSPYEIKLRQLLRERIVRGMVYLRIFIEAPDIKTDLKQAKAHYNFLIDLQKNLKLNSDIPIELFLPFKKEIAPQWSIIQKVVTGAINALIKARIEEGAKTLKDINSHLKQIDKFFDSIKRKAPVLEAKRMKKIQTSSELNKEDFSEEQMRFETHFKALKRNISSAGVSGKYCVFLLQEMQRECNTIASKTKDSSVATLIVKLKDEIEKIREQMENVR